MKKEGQNCQAGLVYQSVKNFHPLERQPAIILQTSQIITLYERWHKTILFHHQASLSMQNTEQICSSKISSVKQNNSLMKCVKVLTRWKVILQKQGMVFKFWTQSFWLKHAHCQVWCGWHDNTPFVSFFNSELSFNQQPLHVGDTES